MRLKKFILLFALLGFSVAFGAAPVPPQTGYVTDPSRALEIQAMVQLQKRLALYEIATNRKIAILLLEDLPDENAEAFAAEVSRVWGLDSAEGGSALLLWSRAGSVLLHTSTDLGRRIDDQVGAQIFSDSVLDAIGRGDVSTGIAVGVENLIAVLDSKPSVASPKQSKEHLEPDVGLLSAQSTSPIESRQEVEPAPEVGLSDTPWLLNLPEDFTRIAERFARGWRTGMRETVNNAGEQWTDMAKQLTARLQLGMPSGSSSPAEAFVQYAFLAQAGALLFTVFLFFFIGWRSALLMGGIASAVTLWAATGYLDLAACVLITAVALPILVPILMPIAKRVLRRQDDERWPANSANPPLSPPPQMPAKRVGTAPMKTTHARVEAVAVKPTPAGQIQRQLRAEDVKALTNLVVNTVADLLSGTRIWHVVVALVLVVATNGLIIPVALVFLAYRLYSRGVVYKFVDMLTVSDPVTRQKLLHKFPPPKQEHMNQQAGRLKSSK